MIKCKIHDKEYNKNGFCMDCVKNEVNVLYRKINLDTEYKNELIDTDENNPMIDIVQTKINGLRDKLRKLEDDSGMVPF